MSNLNPVPAAEAPWLDANPPERDSLHYLRQLRRRWWQVLLPVVVALLAAAAYVKTATPVYQAQSTLLLSPVPSSAALPISIPGLIPESADPTRDAETAANVITSLRVAAEAKRVLGSTSAPTGLLNHISVQPVANSSVLAITAQAPTAVGSARLANAFAQAVITTRTATFRAAIGQQIAGLRARIAAAGAASATSPATTSLAQQLAELQSLASGALPDMSISSPAVPPPGRTSPRASFSIAVGLVVGLIIGLLGTLGLDALDSTLRQEDELKARFKLPILARIPRDGGRKRRIRRGERQPRTPDTLSPSTLEAFRTLRAMTLVARDRQEAAPRSILVTSAVPSEGKTTTALNLAWSMAAAGSRVILIEADLRRPSIGSALRLLSPYDMSKVLTGEVTLERALVSSKRYPGLRVLLARGVQGGDQAGDALFLPSVGPMLEEAKRLADVVVIDAPPLTAVIDALELARLADAVLLVAQLGQTHLGRLDALGTLLADAHIRPVGIALVGGALPGGSSVYEYQYQAAQPPHFGPPEEEAGDVNGRGRRRRGRAAAH